MVQGVPAIDWKKPENNAKLFAAVLALIPGTPDCKKIAKAFGESALGFASYLSQMRPSLFYYIAAAHGLISKTTKLIEKANLVLTQVPMFQQTPYRIV